MRTGLRISSLVPSGLAVENVSDSSDSVIFTIRSAALTARCPLCGSVSRRIHSRYTRQVADLPSVGRAVRLLVISQRFACEVRHCRRRTFAERFDGTLPVRARRTGRLECVVHHLGLALGGRPAASLAKRLMLPVSNDTLPQALIANGRRQMTIGLCLIRPNLGFFPLALPEPLGRRPLNQLDG